ncbi:MAG: TonB-dependent receptor [Pseudomonadota bacterium]|nr:hypothetical protein [Gammaproteobacteria bacterium]MEE2683601.1 TonB-dependent receptor [Pseudomonadota bacterium]|tara:strand:- start:228 stop:2267 length:2040 start_codon:yes stop_codon:yes gene_type:complete
MIKNNAIFISFIFLYVFLNTALSQELNNVIEEVITESTRLEQPLLKVPSSISIITKEEIEQGRQEINIDEALSVVPGLFIQNRYNFAQDLRISIRGFGSRSSFGIRGIKILVDGIPETLPDGQGQVDSIDISSIKQIEVIRSPSSSIYGNASGGIINFISDDNINSFLSTKFISGDHGFNKKQIKINKSSNKINYSFGIAETNYQGYRQHSQSTNKQFYGKINIELDNNKKLITSFNHTNQPLSKDPGAINISQVATNRKQARDKNILFDSGEELKNNKFGLTFIYPINKYHSIKSNIFNISRDFKNKLPFKNGGSVDLSRSFSGGGLSYTYNSKNNINNRLIIGIDIENQNDNRKRYDNINGVLGNISLNQKEIVKTNAFYIREEFNYNLFDIALGLRNDNISFIVDDYLLLNGNESGKRILNNTSPSISILYNLRNNIVLFSNLSTSFQTPTTTEFSNPSGEGGFNPNLNAQSSKNIELGLRSSSNKINYEIILFKNKSINEILPYEIEQYPGRSFYKNIGKTNREGIELYSKYMINDNFTIISNYTFSNFEFDYFIDDTNDFSGNSIPGFPENIFFTEFLYKNNSFFSSIDFQYVDKIFITNNNAVSTDKYFLSNMRMGFEYKIDNFTISSFFGINNLFNQDYNSNLRINAFGARYYEPAPRRATYLGISVTSSLQ